jgi:protein SCO1/2
MPMKPRWLLAGLGLVMGLGLMVAIVLTRPYQLHGSVIDPPRPAPDLVLPASDGRTFDLAQQSGRVTAIFFGYTSCPDVCPATMAEMRQVFLRLGQQSEGVNMVWVTVDPARDTPELMQRYLAAFNPSFTGLAGTLDQLEPVWKAWGVYRKIQGDDPKTYTVDHTARLYVIDKKGRLRLTYPMETNLDDIVQDLNFLLKEN